jgi:Xaa-Pro aminopeptidase
VHERQGKTLVHHAGHKIGESCLMQPQFLLDNNTALQVGDFYTVESGAYQNFGVRLENDFLLTEDGAEDLFEEILPLNIEEYILK